MRILIFIAFIFFASCYPAKNSVAPDRAIIGSWKLMGMTREPFPLREITESDVMGGSMTFKEDKTFEGTVTYPKMPEKNLKVSGTYKVEGETLTISNPATNTTTSSKLRFEDDFMVATPVTPNAFIAYYKRQP